MRLQIELRYVLALAAVGAAFVAFVRILLDLPHWSVDLHTVAVVALGLLPFAFLGRDNRVRYACFAFTMAGTAGLVLMARGYLTCDSRRGCPAGASSGVSATAALVYGVYLSVAAWLWVRYVKPATANDA